MGTDDPCCAFLQDAGVPVATGDGVAPPATPPGAPTFPFSGTDDRAVASGGEFLHLLDRQRHRLPESLRLRLVDMHAGLKVTMRCFSASRYEAVEGRPETAVQIAAAAEVYAHQQGIVNVYSDETPGREFVDQARVSLSADVVASATEVGSKLTIGEALDLARLPQTTAT